MLGDTIAAISTALAQKAIAIVRMSGSEVLPIMQEIFDRDLSQSAGNRIIYGHIMEDGEYLDEVLVSFFKAPKSYTKEDLVEINCHGGVYVTRKVLALCLRKGARLALPGEFTKRAYLHGRIDLSKAESINDMINAHSEVQRKSAMKGIDGSITKLIEPLRAEIMAVIGRIEVTVDYPEYEDVEEVTNEILRKQLAKWLKETAVMIAKAERFRYLKDGLKTAIVGKPNVGKSSLLNALLKKDKAIVTAIPGTTRDLVEDSINLENITLHLIDTAGIRASEDPVEKIGIERSKKAIEQADLVILVLDSANALDAEDEELLALTKDKERIIVYNKSDLLPKGKAKAAMAVSALHNDVGVLIDNLNARFAADQSLIDEDILNNERQIALLKRCRDSLKNVAENAERGVTLDLLSIDLQEAYHYLSEILGKVYDDDLLDRKSVV